MLISTQNSLPGMFILLFTILTWILFFSIYFSNKHNRLNCWAFLAGMCFSSGILKEYLYFSVVPSLITAYPQVDLDFYTQVYSVMTAILYYFSMPCVMIMAFYYSGIDKKLKPAAFRLLQCLAFLPPPCLESSFHTGRPDTTKYMSFPIIWRYLSITGFMESSLPS